MKVYFTKDIRNVGIVGHGGTGKTQLVSSLLWTAGATPRFGKVAEGSTTTDWDEEEIGRKISLQTGLAYAEWAPTGKSEKVKINFIDLPGYSTFINEAKASLIAADAALIVVDAHTGAQVTTEKVWDYATEYDIPRVFVLNWMDRELASFERSMQSLEKVFGRGVAESVKIVFDPSKITYGQILQIFLAVGHNPTQLNRQGPDEGTQYRSSIFYAGEEQQRIASAYIAQLDEARVFQQKIVTQVVPLKAFYPAEDYHQDYLAHHTTQPYIVINDLPKLSHLRKEFPELYVAR